LPETRLRKPEAQEYVVEKIVGHKYDKKGSQLKYLVRWDGYGPQFDTWETWAHLKNAVQILAEYRREHEL
jgi:hypothetical protein